MYIALSYHLKSHLFQTAVELNSRLQRQINQEEAWCLKDDQVRDSQGEHRMHKKEVRVDREHM